MAFLIDTSVLMRLANTADALFPAAFLAVNRLHLRGEALHLTAQSLIEFRNAATRPVVGNGLGLSASDVELRSAVFESRFPLLPETADIFPAWKQIVASLGVIGKQVHDARLLAVCHVNSMSHLLTFNLGHFRRLARIGPPVTVVDPLSV